MAFNVQSTAEVISGRLDHVGKGSPVGTSKAYMYVVFYKAFNYVNNTKERKGKETEKERK